MFRTRDFALRKIRQIGPRYMPFADVANEDLPLSRLLRLSLFQVTVGRGGGGVALVLLLGTLNRVMKSSSSSVPATLVGVMIFPAASVSRRSAR